MRPWSRSLGQRGFQPDGAKNDRMLAAFGGLCCACEVPTAGFLPAKFPDLVAASL